MFAIVDAEMSTSPSAPRCRRSAASGAFVSVNGTCAASLMSSLPQTGADRPDVGYACSTDHARAMVDSQQTRWPSLASAFQFLRNVPDDHPRAQGPAAGVSGSQRESAGAPAG